MAVHGGWGKGSAGAGSKKMARRNPGFTTGCMTLGVSYFICLPLGILIGNGNAIGTYLL